MSLKTSTLLMALALAACSSGGPANYLIVAADELADSAKRYRDFRAASGHQVDLALTSAVVGDAPDSATAVARLRAHVQSRHAARDPARPFFLLVLGDATPAWPGDRRGVPSGTWIDPATGASVTSDNVYADLDDDDLPDLAVGRIAVDSDAEADLVRAKVAAYETTYEVGTWNRRINLFASTAGYGEPADGLIESQVFDIVEAISYDYDVSMTYARQDSPFVYVPELFSDQVYSRINEGSLLVAYIGHGTPDGFAALEWGGRYHPILDTTQLQKIAVSHKSPILLFVACLTGAFDVSESISERILALPEAPVAILSSTEISNPYANGIFVYEAARAFTGARADTVGAAFVLAKRRLIENDDAIRQQIDALSAFLVPEETRKALKRSHLHMYTLFGDPAMPVALPGKATAVSVAPRAASPGTDLAIGATLPGLEAGGEALVTLEARRRQIPGTIAPVPADDDPGRDAVISANYAAANDRVVASVTVPLTGPVLETTLTVPASLPAGSYHVKIYAHDARRDAAGSAPVELR